MRHPGVGGADFSNVVERFRGGEAGAGYYRAQTAGTPLNKTVGN